MGVVHLATRRGQRAALKSLRPGIGRSRENQVRFEREIIAGLRIRSPHVASIIDFDLQASTPYIAWEYVQGPTLAQQVMADGPITGPALVDLAKGLALGVAAMAQAGVSHRDLKASNVLMADHGPVIIDLGIAGINDGEDVTLTQTGQVVGSPCWMAPERLAGESATSETDVFGWGALLHYASVGNPPFGTGSPAAVMYRIASDQIEPNVIPGRLGALVERALQADCRLRPTPGELLAAVQALDGDQSGPTIIQGISDPDADRWPSGSVFFGREAELDLLVGDINRGPAPTFWCIEGPVGVGKTRLLEEVAARARESGCAVTFITSDAPKADSLAAMANTPAGSLVLFDDAADLGLRLGDQARHVIQTLLHRGVGVMGAVRTEDVRIGHPLVAVLSALDRRHLLGRLPLAPLETCDAYALYRSVADLDPMPNLMKRSGGNPLLVCQLARQARVAHAAGTDGRAPLMALELLGGLSEAACTVARTAACVGDRFRFADLARVITDAPTLLDGFEECVRARVLVESNDGQFGWFTYGALRDQLMTTMCSARRDSIVAAGVARPSISG